MSRLNDVEAPTLFLSLLISIATTGCYVAPGEQTSTRVSDVDVDVAPAPRPVPLCRDPEIKDITCRYGGIVKGTLIGEPRLLPSEPDPFVDRIYTQDCKYTIGLMDDLGDYCAINQVADPQQRVCDATSDIVLPVKMTAGPDALPITLATVQRELASQCAFPIILTDARAGWGACCPKPPLAPNLDPIPPVPANNLIPTPLPANNLIPTPLPANNLIPTPLPARPPTDGSGSDGGSGADSGSGEAP